MEKKNINAEQTRDFLFAHPFSDRTIKKGLFLSFIAFALLLSVWLKADIDGFPFLGIKFKLESTQGLQFILWIICIAKLARYFPAFITDLGAEFERRRQINGFFATQELDISRQEAERVDDEQQQEMSGEYHGPHDLDPWWEYHYDLKEKLESKVEGLRPLSGNYKVQFFNRWISIFTEGFSPILLAVIALYISALPAWQFFKIVI